MRPIYEWWAAAEAEIAIRVTKGDDFLAADVIMSYMREVRDEAEGDMRERIAVEAEKRQNRWNQDDIRALPLSGDEPDYSDDKERDRYLAEGGDPH